MSKEKLSQEQEKIKKLEKANKKLTKKLKEAKQPKDFYEEYSQPYNPEYEKRRIADTKYILVIMGVGIILMFLGLFILWLIS